MIEGKNNNDRDDAMFSIDLSKETEKRLQALVEKTHKSKEYYVEKALENLLEEQEDYYEAMEILERVEKGEEKTYLLSEIE